MEKNEDNLTILEKGRSVLKFKDRKKKKGIQCNR